MPEARVERLRSDDVAAISCRDQKRAYSMEKKSTRGRETGSRGWRHGIAGPYSLSALHSLRSPARTRVDALDAYFTVVRIAGDRCLQRARGFIGSDAEVY